MKLRKLIIPVCLFMFCATGVLAQGTPQIYTIKKGDTLWGISQRFISDPLYWPNLWANNPDIHNPHLIYPGQKLAIYDGRIELLPEYKQQQEQAGDGNDDTSVPQAEETTTGTGDEQITFTAYGDLNSFISTAQLQQVGRIVDTVDNRIMMTRGDTVFVQMSDPDAAEGNKYAIYTLGKEVKHPQRKREVIGRQLIWRGALQLTDTHKQVYAATITAAAGEIVRGDILLPVIEPETSINLRKCQGEAHGCIVAADPEKLSLGQHDICYIDLGNMDGIEVGNILTIVRPRKATDLGLQDKNIELPDTVLGQALVVKVAESNSALLILKATQEIFIGDLVTTDI